ncbi:alpha/beta fold hydrolase [Streptomyces sp. NPDC020141]|uniref:alpha/beta fold hydrolase n=1 Tax=Streptomyces sp. NPDC020141 TaxID=3365065 RepID=UPI0037977DC9
MVHDRGGLGRSPRDPAARTLGRMAEDLTDLLDRLGPGPFVLVGHSWGGPRSCAFAAGAAPVRAADLVPADPADEARDLFFERSVRRQERIGRPAGCSPPPTARCSTRCPRTPPPTCAGRASPYGRRVPGPPPPRTDRPGRPAAFPADARGRRDRLAGCRRPRCSSSTCRSPCWPTPMTPTAVSPGSPASPAGPAPPGRPSSI